MSCQTRAKQVSQTAVHNGIPASSSQATALKRPSSTYFWRGYAKTIRQTLKQWRSKQDDAQLLQMRMQIVKQMIDQSPSPQAIAQQRAKLLLHPPKSLTMGERVERVAILDNVLALLRQQNRMSEAQYRDAMLNVAIHYSKRSQAPVRWLPERPIGIEQTAVSQVDPAHTIQTRFRLVDLAEPIVSNTLSGEINPDYDQDLQPRRRNRTASRQQINTLAQKLNPETLLNSNARWDDGPPIVSGQGMIESGNGRLLALRKAAQDQPKLYQQYKKQLAEQARQFGFDRAEVSQMKRPVLIRERLTKLSKSEQLAFVTEANSSRVARMGAAEQARADMARLPAGFLTDLQVSDSDRSLAAILRKRSNQPVIHRFLNLLPETERASLLDQQGSLSTDGVQRLELAIFAYTLPGASGERLSRLIYEEGEALDRIGAGLKSAIPLLGQVEDRIQAGHLDPDLRLGADLAVAIEKLRDLRQSGLRVNDYLRQHKLIPELTAFQEQILIQLDARRNSGRAVRDLLNTYAKTVLQTPSPQQTPLLKNATRITPTNAFRSALKMIDGQWVDLSNWSAAQQTMIGFDLPATEIEKIDHTQQQLGMLVVANINEV
ncbi:MAG: hypothetical protein AAF629_05295 [Chloroflexota bacterium]